MTLVAFFIVLVIVLAAVYILNSLWVPPRPIQVIVNVVAGLIVFFMVLALFNLMPLPFNLK
jgi:hypothetical protein